LVVVMPRAVQPVTEAELDAADPDHYPDITAESKPEDFGRMDGRVVALDYGLPYADMVRERRAHFRKHPRPL
jgi:hypothetical protein